MSQNKKTTSKIALKNVEEHRAKGDWNPLWDDLLKIDPEFIEAYLNFRAVPHKKGPIPPTSRKETQMKKRHGRPPHRAQATTKKKSNHAKNA